MHGELVPNILVMWPICSPPQKQQTCFVVVFVVCVFMMWWRQFSTGSRFMPKRLRRRRLGEYSPENAERATKGKFGLSLPSTDPWALTKLVISRG